MRVATNSNCLALNNNSKMKIFLAATIFAISLSLFGQQDLRTVYNEGIKAYEAEDYSAFLEKMKIADEISPDHPTITYNLAAAYARNDQQENALKYLKKFTMMNASVSPEEDEDFSTIRELSEFQEVLALRKKLNTMTSQGSVAFTNDEKDLHPESVAFDPKTGTYFLNSVRKGKIVKSADGKMWEEFSSGHWAVMGMKVSNDYLWACEVATAEHEKYSEENDGKTALLQFEINSGELVGRYEIDGGHWLGDLIISGKGKIYLSDSRAPIIYTLDKDKLEIFQDFSDQLFNLQGITFSKNENLLYIADYKVGLHVFDLKSKELSPLALPKDMISKGIDGLYFYQNSLIAIQNGVNPYRVARYQLDKSGKAVTACTFLDKARPELGEPTLGVIIDNKLLYVANSPWGAYEDGALITTDLEDNLILSIELD